MRKEEKDAKRVYDLMTERYHTHRTRTHPEGWFYNEMLEILYLE